MLSRSTGLVISVIAVSVGSPAACYAADWPVFGRDYTRNAVSLETNPPTDWDVETYLDCLP